MPVRIYSGIDSPDGVAVTISGGQTLRMEMWVDVSRRAVRSRLVRIQDNGAEIEVFQRTVFEVEAAFGPDCLKVVASGSVVVAHWLESDVPADTPQNPRIRRFTFDLEGLDTGQWIDRGVLSVERFMHDLMPVEGHASDFLICFMTTADVLVVRRFNGLDWIDIDWSANANGGTAVAFFAASVYANDTDGDALVTFENTGANANQVWTTRFASATGAGAASVRTFTALPDDVYLFQVSHARYATRDVVVLIEAAEIENSFDVPLVAGVRISSQTASPSSDEHAVYHLRLLGRAFSCAGARLDGAAPNVHALVGYKQSVVEEWGNGTAWVVNLSAQDWVGAGDNTVRPRPCATFNFGDIDTRVSGYTPDGGAVLSWGTERRVGCIPHAQVCSTTGRTVKGRAWAVLGFAKLMAISSYAGAPLQPTAATALLLRFFPEEPTVVYRDASDPTPPETCYLGENPHVVGDLREAGAGAAIGGGTPSYYDGHAIVPIGYPWPPETFDITDNGAGGMTALGTYLYTATWEWRDAAGQLHRSAPGPIATHTLGMGQGQVIITLGTLSLDTRDDAFHYPTASPINCVLWRTEAGGIVFYRLYAVVGGSFEVRDTPENDPFGDFITAGDNVADADLVEQEALPFALLDGAWSPLPPYPPPASNAIAKWQNRIWLASSQDTRLLYYSQEMLPEPGGTRTLPPEFNPSLVVRIDGLGRVLAMEPRDQELILFTSDAIYSLTGIGADGAGQNASYQVTDVMRGIGCIDARSIVTTAAGIFFQSHHGLYCLTGNGVEHVQIGAHVQDTIRTGGNLRGACYLKDRAAVRWVSNGAPEGEPLMLELDLQHLRWSVSPLALGDQPGGSDALCATAGSAVWTGMGHVLHVVLQRGALLIERASTDATPWADQNRSGAVAVPLRVRLAPIHLDGIDGFQRVRRWTVAVEKPDASGVQVTYYAWRTGRYESVAGEPFTFASPAEERLVINGPRVQQCAAAWIDIEEIEPVPTTENLRIVGTHIEAGIKRGLRRS
jgi:hypothetical protein